MKTNKVIIDLRKYKVNGSKVFMDSERAKLIREELEIDRLSKTNVTFETIIPKDIYSISTSFFVELFYFPINLLGVDDFLEKFKFTSLSDYDYVKNLNEAIRLSLQ